MPKYISKPIQLGNRIGKIAIATLFTLCLAQCGKAADPNLEEREKEFDTDGVISRYHTLLSNPFVAPLTQQGYIIGIEKSPRNQIGVEYGKKDGTKNYDTDRLVQPIASQNLSEADLDEQIATFAKVNNDDKVMFVSHIVSHSPDSQGSGMRTKVFYSAYSPSISSADVAYKNGWEQLDLLEDRLSTDLSNAVSQGKKFSHLVFLSMGWNNDQIETMERYNAILSQIRESAAIDHADFKPLVVGLTWPSVWGGTSVSDLANRALHLGSYGVKANDADEIGFGIANHVMNKILPNLENQQKGLQTVAIGHSMGARILTRAHYSAPMLKQRVHRNGEPPIIISLQGAFSANRFNEDHELSLAVRWLFKGEGSPYQNHNEPNARLALTWSSKDTANPLARLLTGARHVGGSPGESVMSKSPIQEKVVPVKWTPGKAFETACETAHATNKLLYVDATSIVSDHGDVKNTEVGKMLWKLINCL